jgi:hypothetical protein
MLEYSQRLRQADDKFQISQYLIKRAQVRQIMRSHALIEVWTPNIHARGSSPHP